MKNPIESIVKAITIIASAYLVGIVGLVISAIISIPILLLAIWELHFINKNKKGKPGPLSRTLIIVVIYIITMYIFSPYMKDIYGVAFLFITALMMAIVLFPIMMLFTKTKTGADAVVEMD